MDAPLYDDFTKVLKKAEFSRVYRPNDDSYFFVKTILADMEAFKEAQVLATTYLIGCGSGFVIGNVAKRLPSASYLAIDISIDACALAARFFSSIGVHVDVLNANGFSGCKLDRAGIDVMMFNPPYVPTETSELTNAADLVTAKQSKFTELFSTGLRGDELLNAIESINLIDSSYAGGIDGMQVTWRIMKEAVKLINKGGYMYIFLVAENQIKELVQFMLEAGFTYTQLATQQKYNEIQFVFRFRKQ